MKMLRQKLRSLFIGILLMGVIGPLVVSALHEDEQNTIEVVKDNVNAVVFITNIQYSRDFFFGSQEVARGTGSGFIWDTRGHIVTNYHVIEEGDKQQKFAGRAEGDCHRQSFRF